MGPRGEADVRRVDEEGFRSLKDEWNALLRRSACDGPFLRWEWMHTWWETFRRRRRLLVLTVRREGRLVGVAPLYIEAAAFPRARRLGFCSDELAPDYLDLIAEPGSEALVARETFRHLRLHAREWDVFSCEALREGASLLADPAALEGLGAAARASFECPTIAVRGTFEEYFGSRSQLSRRYGLTRKLGRLAEKEDARSVVATSPAELSRGLDDLFALHKKRADSKGISTNFSGAAVEAFHRRLAGLFLEQGFLRLLLLYGRSGAISADYCFFYRGKYYLYQGGVDPAYGKYSAGMLALYLAVRRAFAEGASECDFLRGDEAYKYLWTDAARRQVAFSAYSPSARGLAWRAARGAARLLVDARRAARQGG